ncbi:MAG: hypothetical protein M1836_000172 [Candelina mexicana]|nr:MAG: hypothetical protein M1836_000172 [Candelina mexicana]
MEPALPGGLSAAAALLIAAFLRYSSSTARLFLDRKNRYPPPSIAANATTPTTTPAAIPAVLVPFEDGFGAIEDAVAGPLLGVDCPGAVTNTVGPPAVTTDAVSMMTGVGEFGDDDDVGGVEPGVCVDELEPDPPSFATFACKPVRETDHALFPPPVFIVSSIWSMDRSAN